MKYEVQDIEILMSAMNQIDNRLVERGNISTDCIMVNQTDCESVSVEKNNGHRIIRIDTTDRGLSKSRNLAIRSSNAEICMITDDDVTFHNGYDSIICHSFNSLPKASVLVFARKRDAENSNSKIKRLSKLQSLKAASIRICFKRKDIINAGISFDEKIGAGSSFGGCGEENKFILECLKHGLVVYFVPEHICHLRDSDSTWFSGFTDEYFYKRGATTRYIYGLFFSIIYALYFLFFKYSEYKVDNEFVNSGIYLFKGIKDNPLKK